MQKKLVMASWEIGHSGGNFGVRVGGMGLVLQELPEEMSHYAEKSGKDLDIEVLSPCFRFYDRSRMYYEGKIRVPHFNLDFDVYSHSFDEGQSRVKHVYFWNESILGNFGNKQDPQSVYPSDNWQALLIYARISAAMATYLMITGCYALHIHDYHIGFIPFYINLEELGEPAVVFTIHNASYQGHVDIWDDPSPVMYELSMPASYYYRYFQYWGNFNTMKGILLRMTEISGTVTTVSQHYAEELCLSEQDIYQLAHLEGCPPPQKVFLPSRGLSEFAEAKVIGIENGLADENRPENLKYFQASELRKRQHDLHHSIFRHPHVQEQMLGQDHNYSIETLQYRKEMQDLLHLECFGTHSKKEDIIFCAIGRLVKQKNFEVLLGAMEHIGRRYPHACFIIIASPSHNDSYGTHLASSFYKAAKYNPNIYFNDGFNVPLAKLALAGSHFCLIPSSFEPCGLIDYEAALLGTVPIIRKTGGLVKTLPHSLGYSWYDEDNYWGEVHSLSEVMAIAIEEYSYRPEHYWKRVLGCMQLDTSWEKAVQRYFELLKI